MPNETPRRDSDALSADQLRQAWPEALAASPRTGTASPRRGNGRTELTILHMSDTQFGKSGPFGGNGPGTDALFGRLHDDLAGLDRDSGLRPDLVVVTGDLTAEWLRSDFTQGLRFLAALSEADQPHPALPLHRAGQDRARGPRRNPDGQPRRRARGFHGRPDPRASLSRSTNWRPR